MFWKLRSQADDDPRVIPLLRCYTVFNTAQIESLPSALAEPLPSAPDWPSDEVAEELIAASGADIRHAGFKAFYRPAAITSDSTTRHVRQSVGLLRHDAARAGALDRAPVAVDRQLGGRFGDDAFAAEELIAEMGSAFLCAHCRIDGQLQHASYIGNGPKVLRNDKRAILVAGTKAQNAADSCSPAVPKPSGAEAMAA